VNEIENGNGNENNGTENGNEIEIENASESEIENERGTGKGTEILIVLTVACLLCRPHHHPCYLGPALIGSGSESESESERGRDATVGAHPDSVSHQSTFAADTLPRLHSVYQVDIPMSVEIVGIGVILMTTTTSEAAGCPTWIGVISTDMNHGELVYVMKIMSGEGEMIGLAEDVSVKFFLYHVEFQNCIFLTLFFFCTNYSSSKTLTHSIQAPPVSISRTQDFITPTAATAATTSLAARLLFPIPLSCRAPVLI
jgi:hypothetical protein